MTDNRFFDTWTAITDLGIATDDELGLATALCGRSTSVLLSVLYIRTGYRDLEQLECDELLREDEE